MKDTLFIVLLVLAGIACIFLFLALWLLIMAFYGAVFGVIGAGAYVGFKWLVGLFAL